MAGDNQLFELMEWVPVDDKLPARGIQCLVALSRPANPNIRPVDAAIFSVADRSFRINVGYAQVGYKVTHWMPYPPPPSISEVE